YLRPDVLAQHWGEIGQALKAELTESGLSLNEFLKARDSRWRLVGRVHFNLAENRRDPECPFAFMATYTSGLAASGALRHLPLGQALREFAGVGDKAKLLQLLFGHDEGGVFGAEHVSDLLWALESLAWSPEL